MSVVFITGVHQGLGLALATALLDSKWEVHGVSRSEPEVLAGRGSFHFYKQDLTDFDALAPLVSALGDLDLVVLNAGVLGAIADWNTQRMSDIRKVMDINVWANKVLLDALLDGSRSVTQVIGMSSGAAVNCSAGWGPYSVSKAALNALVKVYAEEKTDTHFTAFAPGVIKTPMLEGILALNADPKHTATGRVQATEGTESLQTPAGAAQRMLRAFPLLLKEPSGSFVDIRSMKA